MLSYAGYLQGLDPDQLETQVLAKHLEQVGSVLAAVEAAEQREIADPATFREELARSLADGSFRLVIVVDSAPDELVQVVGYLEMIADKIDIDLVTVTAYDINGSQVLVPQRIEPARRVRELSDAQVTERQATMLLRGSAEFRASFADAPPHRRELLEQLTNWADMLEPRRPRHVVHLPWQRGHRHLAPALGHRQRRTRHHLQRHQIGVRTVLEKRLRAPSTLGTPCSRGSARQRAQTGQCSARDL